jgi:hypothetical protein
LKQAVNWAILICCPARNGVTMLWAVLGVLFLFYTLDWAKFVLDLTEMPEIEAQRRWHNTNNRDYRIGWDGDFSTMPVMDLVPILKKPQDKVNWRCEGF